MTSWYITNLSGDTVYQSFRPSPLPPELNIDNEMLSLLTGATKAIAELDTLIDGLGRQGKTSRLIFDYNEKNPIIEVGKASHELGISFNTASSHINRLVEHGILVQANNSERRRVFAYEEYLSILRKDT